MEKLHNILVVDDEASARTTIKSLLHNEPYELHFAEDGGQALNFLANRAPDILLVDVMMPDMDGFELCRRIKANPAWRHYPILMITALDGKDDLVNGLAAGADDFLTKPVNGLELRARVRSMLRIKQQYDELQAALKMREDMAHMIVHDMRNPLSAMVLGAGILKRYENLSEKAVMRVNQIIEQAHRLEQFINDLLLLAKMTSGKLLLNTKPTDVQQLMQALDEDFEELAEAKNIKLRMEIAENLPALELDESLIKRSMDNLMSNAIKYSAPGDTVTVTATMLPGQKLRLQVLDQGIGIPEAERDRIFDQFQVASLKKEGVTQIGLGLAFCRLVAEAHGGAIRVNSNEPKGSVFTIEI